MNLPAGLFDSDFLWLSFALYALVMWRAVRTAQWLELIVSRRTHVFFGATVVVALLWSMKAGISPGLAMHFLAVTSLTLMFGWQLALVAVSLALAIVTVAGHAGWAAFPVSALLTGVLPVLISHGLYRAVLRYLPRHLFVYLYLCAFLGGALAILSSTLATAGLLKFLGIYSFAQVAYEYLVFLPLLVLPEAILNGIVVTALVVLKPEWVATYSDERFLNGK